jgi:hypothetical protein
MLVAEPGLRSAKPSSTLFSSNNRNQLVFQIFSYTFLGDRFSFAQRKTWAICFQSELASIAPCGVEITRTANEKVDV